MPGRPEAQDCRCTTIRNNPAVTVGSYLELASKIAELQYRNRDYVLLFRGQREDHRNSKNNTTLKPSLFRGSLGSNPTTETLQERFAALDRAECSLVKFYSDRRFLGRQWVERHQIVRWAILQHYEVCPTPLLDVTHSLRIGASFATINNKTKEAFLFVLGVPNLNGAITASAEAGIQIVRLSSVCPPSALRPHIQEGYLLGEYPQMVGITQIKLYEHYEIDFGLRLVAKFQFNPKDFWEKDEFPKLEERALYPPHDNDAFGEMANDIKSQL